LLTPRDLHVLSTPPAFVLSQDQTLQELIRLIRTGIATLVAVCPNHFLVRQCSLPGHLNVCPDRRVRLALPSTLNPVVKQRKKIGQNLPVPGSRQCYSHDTIGSSGSEQPLEPVSIRPTPTLTGLSAPSRDPNPSNFDLRRKWGKTDVGWVMADGRPRRSDQSGSVRFRTQNRPDWPNDLPSDIGHPPS
jgi:hypothetical protein